MPRKPKPTLIPLPPVLDTAAATPLAAALRVALAGGKPILVDASSVQRLGTACAQVLVAAAGAGQAAGLELSWKAPSESFVAAFEDLGLFPVLMSWQVVE